jgi:pimeloyl-ACP methyl ester carboxylesterase
MHAADFKHHFTDVGDVKLHHVSLAAAPDADPHAVPAVLIHGWPETWYEWRHVMPEIARDRPVIAPDMRGLGDSSRPLHGYDKKTVAGDINRLVSEHLGIKRYHLVGHDWGGPTAFALACANPAAIASFTLIDVVIPGDGGDFSQGGRRWHHAFHATPDLPEALVTGRERTYLSWFYGEFSWRPDAFDEATLTEYLRTYTQPGALRAGFSFYRTLGQDAADNAKLLDTGFKLEVPVLALGGAKWEARGRGTEPEESMRRVATNVRGMVIDDSGHFVPEEQPEVVARELRKHFTDAE